MIGAGFVARMASASLFVRVLLLLFVTVLMAQAVAFALVLMMPTPSLPTTELSVIAQALQTGKTADSSLKIGYGPIPWDNKIDPSERYASARLAAALRMNEDFARIVFVRERGGPSSRPADLPPGGDGRSRKVGGVLGPGSGGGNPRLEDNGIVTGRFEAGMRLPDGRWRLVSREDGSIAPWQWEILLWLIGSVAVVAPFAWFFARRLAEPIAAFGAAARQLGRNPSGEPIQIHGPPEIHDAAAAVNEMQRQIWRYVEDRTMMVGAIAHDLRTPLMRLSLRLQKAPDDLREASEQDIREIEDMATAALSFVRDLSSRDNRHRLALRSIVETVADEFADRDADVSLEPGEDTTLIAEPNGIKRMVCNIVGNAVAYAGGAHVRLVVRPDAAVIEVADTGPGIPVAELERVFDPFYRVEQSRNRNTGGTGLGLASARAVARSHGGDIVLTNRVGGGLLATIRLPL